MLTDWLVPTDIAVERLDPSFYEPAYVECEHRITRNGRKTLNSLCKRIVDHSFLKVRATDYVPNGIPFVRVKDLGDLILETGSLAYITQEAHQAEGNTIFRPGNILVAKTGKLAVSIVPPSIQECNTSQDVMGAVVRDEFDPYYVTAFLGCRTGILQQERWQSGQVQPHLTLGNLRRLYVVVPGVAVQRAIGNKIRKAERLRVRGTRAKLQAHELLAHQLDMPTTSDCERTTSWAAIDGQHGRLDAEYYQSQYLSVDRYIETPPKTVLSITALELLLQDRGFGVLPSSSDYGHGELPFLRAQDVGEYLLDYHAPVMVPRSYANPKAITRVNDVLLEIKGQISGGAICPPPAEGFLINGSICRMTVKDDIHPYYLLAVLLSPLGVLQKRRAAANSVISYLSIEFLNSLMIPRIDKDLENRIADGLAQYCDDVTAAGMLIAGSINDVEALIDGTLDEGQLFQDDNAIASWLEANPLPE